MTRIKRTKVEIAELIVNTSFEMVKEHSHSNLSTRKIAKNIGYTVGIIYHLFQSVEDIFLKINAITIDNMLRQLNESIEAIQDPIEKLRAAAYCYHDFSIANFHLWQLLFEYRFQNIEIPAWYQTKIDALYEFIDSLTKKVHLQLDQNSGAVIFWSGIHGIVSLTSHGKLERMRFQPGKVLIQEFLNHVLASK